MQCPKCERGMYPHRYHDKGVFQYDGPSEMKCVNVKCGYRIGYFCNQPLGIDEVEPVNCEGCKYHPRFVVL